MNASEVSFTVTPETLLQKSQQIGAEVSKLRSLFDAVESAVKETGTFWQGEAGDAHRGAYNSRREDFSMMIARLQEHVTDLNQIAGNYIQFETQVREMEEALPDNVIV